VTSLAFEELRMKGWTVLRNCSDSGDIEELVKVTRKRYHNELHQTGDHFSKTDLESWTAGEAPLSLRLSSRCLKLCLSPSLQEFLKSYYQQFESNVELFLHLAPALRVVSSGDRGALVSPHNDYFYNRHLSRAVGNAVPFLTCWFGLTGSSRTHGGLRVWDSDRNRRPWGVLGDNESSSMLNFLSERKSHVVEWETGDVVVFEPWLIHGSVGHDSPSPRISLDARYFSRGTTSSRHYLRLADGAHFEPLTGPNAP